MATTPIHDALRCLPHFRGLAPELLERIAAGCRLREVRAGQLVFAEGEPVRAFYAVLEGGVRLYRLASDGREQVLHHIRPGHSFAEAALLTMHAYPASAAAMATPTRLLEIGGETFLPLFRSEPRLAAAMVASLSVWLLQLVERVEDLSIPSAESRLARWLLRLPAHAGAGGLAVTLPMTKKELAAQLAMTPETLSRLLRRWQDCGLLETRGRELVLRKPQDLTAVADREESA